MSAEPELDEASSGGARDPQGLASGRGSDVPGRSPCLSRWAAGLSVLPIPIWFTVTALLAPAPAWRAEYRSRAERAASPGEAATVAPSVVVAERELQHYWDKNNAVMPGGVDVHAFSARYEACLSLAAARQVPMMLVADGAASFAVDGVERLRLDDGKQRVTRGEVFELAPGTHRLSVELVARGWSGVALLASFDGRAPRAVGSGALAPGVRVRAPGAGADACAGQ
jgi:hypothetical protein